MEPRDPTCVCCEGRDAEIHLKALLRCRACGHVWADLRLTTEALQALYSARYFKGEEYRDYALEAPALRRNFRARVDELARRYPKGASLWEIGAAYGYFLDEASRHFKVAGCDLSRDAVCEARGRFALDVRCCDYLAEPIDGPHDVICLWDTVEHLQEPHRYLEKAFHELRGGGMIALSTGDIGSWIARRRGPKWRLIHPPTHLHYFTTHSMTALLQRLGFCDIEIRHLSFWRSADAVANHILNSPAVPGGPSCYRMLKRIGISNLSFPLNLFDLMTVYAVKS